MYSGFTLIHIRGNSIGTDQTRPDQTRPDRHNLNLSSVWEKNAAKILALYFTVEFLKPLYQSLS